MVLLQQYLVGHLVGIFEALNAKTQLRKYLQHAPSDDNF